MNKSIEEKYRKLTDVEHVLIRPGRYIGSIGQHTAETWTYENAEAQIFDKKMHRVSLTWNPGFIKLFDEVISNSVDHSKRSEGKNLTMIKVNVDLDIGVITIEDNGGIPVVIHKDYNEYVPTMIFGYLRSGSNFDDTEDSTGTGQNGEGASLTNIFSNQFTVETGDGKNKFVQIWTKNMMQASQPKVTASKWSGTKVTFKPDYAHLGNDIAINTDGDNWRISDGNFAKLQKRVVDVAGCNPHLKIYFRNELVSGKVFKSFKDYVDLYPVEVEYDENEHWQVAVGRSDDGFKHVSFTNTTETVQGGTGVYYVKSQVIAKIREFLEKKHKIKKDELKPSEIENHIQIFVNSTIVNPRYDSQTKENLTTEPRDFKTSWSPSEKFIQRIAKSDIIKNILLWIETKEKMAELAALKELNKAVDREDPRRVDKFSDALSQHERHKCELYLTEGDSARKSIQEARGKNPYIASFALKGKLLNITDCETADILGNKEIKNIMLVTGLKIGVKVKSVQQLRFGRIVIMSDQDLDGFHITSLLHNFFGHFWPELYELGIIYRINTPLVIAILKDKSELEFLTDDDYEQWSKKGIKHEAERYKGLGTFETPRFQKILEQRQRYLVRFSSLSEASQESLGLAFKGSRADDRKDWLAGINYFHKFE